MAREGAAHRLEFAQRAMWRMRASHPSGFFASMREPMRNLLGSRHGRHWVKATAEGRLGELLQPAQTCVDPANEMQNPATRPVRGVRLAATASNRLRPTDDIAFLCNPQHKPVRNRLPSLIAFKQKQKLKLLADWEKAKSIRGLLFVCRMQGGSVPRYRPMRHLRIKKTLCWPVAPALAKCYLRDACAYRCVGRAAVLQAAGV